jgi:hypothetical protein
VSSQKHERPDYYNEPYIFQQNFFPYTMEDAVIYAALAAAEYIDETGQAPCAQYLDPFFKLLRNPMKFKRCIGRQGRESQRL